ncbi:MAG: 7,8-didemethyl-8-hydroxy-5-deazariboflavin synthase CofG, partial [Proteobacteria bacterium]|nr:7,8-didemethyl-8-hydroxy-5-deazariboflavin synthase CofG [Pseudomonadota bacterium]
MIPLLRAATEMRDSGHGSRITFSKNAFIPLTHLCRNVCHYCTFAERPAKGRSVFMSTQEVIEVAQRSAAAGCKEILLTLGDKPELRYSKARQELEMLGHKTTISYLKEVAALIVQETGLLPHLNPGVVQEDEIRQLRGVSVSQGLMLETAAERLCERGGPHFGSPDKHPTRRLETIEAAGRCAVPFTTGLLIGIGETREERIDALLRLREINDRYDHIQELIIQNFKP